MKKNRTGRIVLTALLTFAMVLEPVAGIPVVYAAPEERTEMLPEEPESTEVLSEETETTGEMPDGDEMIETPQTDAEETVEESAGKNQEESSAETDGGQVLQESEEAQDQKDAEDEKAVEEMTEEEAADEDAGSEVTEEFLTFQNGNIASGEIEGTAGKKVVWVIDENHKLTVSGTGEYYTGVGSFNPSNIPWYDHRNEIYSAEVSLSEVKYLAGMFYECENLVSVDLRQADTADATLMSSMFYGCGKLSNVEFGTMDTSKVTDMSNMFSGCKSLTSLDLSGFNTSAVKNMTGMFINCSSLTGIKFGSGFTAVSAEVMSQMFRGCSALTTLDLRSFTVLRGSLSWMFAECSALKTLDLSGVGTPEALDMSYMFNGCSALTSLNLSSFSTERVVRMESMFRDCGKLTSLTFGAGFTGQEALSADSMFYGCSSLTGLDLSHFAPNDAAGMEYMFYNCEALAELKLAENFTAAAAGSMTYMFYNCKSLGSLDISHFNTASANNMRAMFYGCSKMKRLDVGRLNTGSVTNMYGMFYGCSALEGLDVSSFNTALVGDMGYMFYGCSKVKSLDVSKFDTSNVTNMECMFCSCSSVGSLNVGGFRTGNVLAMNNMFYGCSSLTSLDAGSFDTSNVTKIDYMFSGCSRLKELDMRSFNLKKCTSATGVLNNSTALATVYTPCYLTISVKLPLAKSTDKWYDADGRTYSTLPTGLDRSIMLCRNVKPNASEAGLKVTKVNTVYFCGEKLNTDDLVVLYNSVELKAGEYKTNALEIDMTMPGKKILKVTYTDPASGKTLSTEIEIYVVYPLDDTVSVSMQEGPFTYTGYPVRPWVASVTVTIAGKKITLKRDKDYEVTYRNNINVGENTAKLVIEGAGDYGGMVEKTFSITPASLTFMAGHSVVPVGEPWEKGLGYTIDGLQGCDTEEIVLTKKPVCTVTKKNDGTVIFGTDKATTRQDIGLYTIVLEGAAANGNYVIDGYQSGTLTVAEERVAYTVTFDLLNHADDVKGETVPEDIVGVKAGSLIEKPEDPVLDRTNAGTKYMFLGWYKDAACTKAWDFDADTVQNDLTLYAAFGESVDVDGTQFIVRHIMDVYYTGKALKPAVAVYAADGAIKLKAGRDYAVVYKNNIEADVRKTGDDKKGGMAVTSPDAEAPAGGGKTGFDPALPYVAIRGKGNYTGIVYQNFHIRQAEIAEPAMKLKYTDQLVKSTSKAQKPLTSVKYKKTMKAGTDYTVSLTALSAWKTAEDKTQTAIEKGTGFDGVGGEIKAGEKDLLLLPVIPTDCYGTFLLTVKGIGNYTGMVTKTIHVVESKEYLLKNVKITIGAGIKKNPFKGAPVILHAGIVVTEPVNGKNKNVYYKTALDEMQDEKLENGKSVYTVRSGKTYLRYGRDFTVSFTNNAAVGTATMTIIGMGGYAGKKSVTYKITGMAFNARNVLVKTADEGAAPSADLFRKSMVYTGKPLTQNGVTLLAAKGGVIRNGTELKAGDTLVYGTDYIIKYKNNLKKGTATMTFMALPASGWTGSFKKTFKITEE